MSKKPKPPVGPVGAQHRKRSGFLAAIRYMLTGKHTEPKSDSARIEDLEKGRHEDKSARDELKQRVDDQQAQMQELRDQQLERETSASHDREAEIAHRQQLTDLRSTPPAAVDDHSPSSLDP